jgi:hypothetical protein
VALQQHFSDAGSEAEFALELERTVDQVCTEAVVFDARVGR